MLCKTQKAQKVHHENEVFIFIPIPVTRYLRPGTTTVTICVSWQSLCAYEYRLFFITRTRVNYILFCTLTL